MDLQMVCTCGQYLIAPSAYFVEKVEQHVRGLHPSRGYSADEIRELATPAA